MPRPPKTFGEFIGQQRVCKLEQRLVDGARQRGEAVLSQLLIGPSGAGKSTLAYAVAGARGAKLITLLAGRDTSAVEICDALLGLSDCDVLFVDEAHALKREAQEIISNALSTKQVPKRTAKGTLDRTAVDNLAANFTVILATTDPGFLASALLTRLQSVTLESYSIAELKLIGRRVAEQRGLKVTAQALRRLAEVAQGLPRVVERLVEQLPVFFPKVVRFTLEQVVELLTQLGIDEEGLDVTQRGYLKALAAVPSKCRSLSSVAGTLGVDAGYVRRLVEPHLISKGLVEIEARGRILTAKGAAVVATFIVPTTGPDGNDDDREAEVGQAEAGIDDETDVEWERDRDVQEDQETEVDVAQMPYVSETEPHTSVSEVVS